MNWSSVPNGFCFHILSKSESASSVQYCGCPSLVSAMQLMRGFLLSHCLEILGVVGTDEITTCSGINTLGLRKKMLPELGFNSQVDCS